MNWTIIRIECRKNGFLELDDARILLDQLRDQLSRGYSIILDFSDVEFLSSGPIGHLVLMHRIACEHDRELVICGLNDKINYSIEVSKINRLMPIYRTLEEAIRFGCVRVPSSGRGCVPTRRHPDESPI